jgi:hypothetical protein
MEEQILVQSANCLSYLACTGHLPIAAGQRYIIRCLVLKLLTSCDKRVYHVVTHPRTKFTYRIWRQYNLLPYRPTDSCNQTRVHFSSYQTCLRLLLFYSEVLPFWTVLYQLIVTIPGRSISISSLHNAVYLCQVRELLFRLVDDSSGDVWCSHVYVV